MKKIKMILPLAGALAVLLSGCQMGLSTELYRLPMLSQDYTNLQDELEELIGSGLEYAAPKAGENTQPVQFQDLDGDGTDEAVGFFRDPSSERPLKVYIFRRAEELYQVSSIIEGEGTAFRSVAYTNLDDSQMCELVVNYQMSDQVYTLCAYSIQDGSTTELLRSGCTRYVVADLDGDAVQELVLLQMDASEETAPRSEYYDFVDGSFSLQGTAPLTAGMTAISRVRNSYLADGTPALFVTGSYGEGLLVTDVLAVRDGMLTNVTLDESVTSTITLRDDPGELFFAMDLNGDSAYDIPLVSSLNHLGSSGAYLVEWFSYGLDGSEYLACTTVSAPRDGDGWYLQVNEAWINAVTALRVESSTTDEIAVTFYYCPQGVDAITQGEPEADGLEEILTIYTIRGNNRESRSRMEGRIVLSTQSDAIYAAKLAEGSWDSGITAENVTQLFHFMPNDWSTSD